MHFDNFPATDRSLKHRCPSSGQSTITMASAMFSADQYNGAQIVVSVPSPGAGSDTYRVGTVIDTTTSTLKISDNATLNESIAKALAVGVQLRAAALVAGVQDPGHLRGIAVLPSGRGSAPPYRQDSESGKDSHSTWYIIRGQVKVPRGFGARRLLWRDA